MAGPKPLPVLLIEHARELTDRNALLDAEVLLRHASDLAAGKHENEAAHPELKASALFSLGRVLEKQGRSSEALGAFEEALKAVPASAGHKDFTRVLYNNIGNILKSQNRLDEACLYFEHSLQIKPVPATYAKLGNTLKEAGRCQEAVAAYSRAVELDPSFHLARFGRCIAELSAICRNHDEVIESRERYGAALDELCDYYARATPQERKKAAEIVGLIQPFYIGYQGFNDRSLQERYGRLVCSLMWERFPQWTRLEPARSDTRRKLRIGIVSRFIFCRHSVWKLPLKGLTENIDRTRFDVFGYHTHPDAEYGPDYAPDLFAKFVHGRRPVEAWCEEIRNDALDAIIYPEVVMDPFSLPLACLRLAPVQVTTLGHPITTGLPTIDYYLSGELLETADGQSHYTEKLITLPNLSFFYTPMEAQGEPLSRDKLGLAEGEVFFWCPQAFFKFLPEHDDVFPRIAKGSLPCKFLFNSRFRDRTSSVFSERLRQSFEAAGMNADDYCIIRYGIAQKEYNDINATADIFLDSIGWSGGNTNIEALAHDLPIVTFPTEFMRGRFAYGMLKRIGVEETIAASKDDFVRIAIRLARDPNYRRAIAERIARNKHKLYHDLTPIRALEDFLTAEIERRRTTLEGSENHVSNSRAAISFLDNRCPAASCEKGKSL